MVVVKSFCEMMICFYWGKIIFDKWWWFEERKRLLFNDYEKSWKFRENLLPRSSHTQQQKKEQMILSLDLKIVSFHDKFGFLKIVLFLLTTKKKKVFMTEHQNPF